MAAHPLPIRAFLAAFLGSATLGGLAACSEESPGGGAGGSGGSTVASGGGGAGAVPSNGGSSLAGSAGATGGNPGGGAATGGAAGGGAGGTAGASGGVAGTGGSGGASNAGAKPSAGCNKAATQPLEQFQSAMLTAKGFERVYSVRLPAGYDPARAYPTVFVAAGCGGTGDKAIPIQNASKADAIVVGLNWSRDATGRDCFMTESPESPDIDYFDAAFAAVKAGYCVDESRVFFEGFSSGSWLTNLIGCARGNVLRGQGNASGGPPPLPTCQGPIATIMVHDTNDNDNKYEGGLQTRERIRELNGCSEQTAPWDAAFPGCVAHQGCPAAYPLVFCTTQGKGHTDNVPISTEGFWKFWSSLPSKP